MWLVMTSSSKLKHVCACVLIVRNNRLPFWVETVRLLNDEPLELESGEMPREIITVQIGQCGNQSKFGIFFLPGLSVHL